MRKLNKIIMALIVMAFVIIPSMAETLNLAEKDPATWIEVTGGATATLTYNNAGSEFEYAIDGRVPDAGKGQPYALIYYKDQPDRFQSWGLVGAVIASDIQTDTETGAFATSGSNNIGSIPHTDDVNYPDGAKIWLVPTANIVDMSLIPRGWHPEQYLFEANIRIDGEEQAGTSQLITYTDTGNANTGETLPDTTPPGEVSNLELAGATDHSLTWSWTNPVDTDFSNTVITVFEGRGTTGRIVPGYDHIKQAGTPGSDDGITVTGLASSTAYTILIQTEDNAV